MCWNWILPRKCQEVSKGEQRLMIAVQEKSETFVFYWRRSWMAICCRACLSFGMTLGSLTRDPGCGFLVTTRMTLLTSLPGNPYKRKPKTFYLPRWLSWGVRSRINHSAREIVFGKGVWLDSAFFVCHVNSCASNVVHEECPFISQTLNVWFIYLHVVDLYFFFMVWVTYGLRVA